ncbi:hypothetical protein HII31_02068 [Pseudocercospora fuligena]|uniref:Uncharacterized protein n=1 Tax=Pseudocercospora fuligena TaxID=685502 RepID=A0A8H6RSU5_9PEZI|nr:hypothetical protein HII31_02068 [Pseudocercospora fuligena]
MQNIRAKIKRKLSMHDKNPNVDDVDDASDVDEETYGNISKDIDRAERDGHDQGKPGSFLNKLILSGNKKTEEQLARESQLSAENKR